MKCRLRNALLASVALSMTLGGCAPEPPPEQPQGPVHRTVSAKAVFMTWQEAGPQGRVQPVLELEAEAGQVRGDQDAGTFERAEARLYNDGTLVARMTAPHVEATMKGKRVRAWGGIVVDVKRPDGLRVRADSMEGFLEKNLVIVRGNVRFVHRDPQSGRLLAEGGVFDTVTIDTLRERLTVP